MLPTAKKFRSNSRYVADNGNGYDYDTRDCICSICGKVLYEEEKYRGVDKDFKSTNKDSKNWLFCHYCGSKFFEED